MKKIVFIWAGLLSIASIITLFEYSKSIDLTNIPVRTAIDEDLKKIYNDEIKLRIIDGDAESNDRYAYFELSTGEKRKVLYRPSFIDNRIKYSKEVPIATIEYENFKDGVYKEIPNELKEQ